VIAPYYADDTVTLFLGDCRDVLPVLPRASVDLIVTDPPYGKNWQSARRKNKLAHIDGDDGTLDVAECITLACKVLRDKRHLYVFRPADLSTCPLGATTGLIWNKGIIGSGDLTIPWGPAHEPITFAVHISRPANRAAGYGRLAARLRKGSVITVPRANSGQLEDRHVVRGVEDVGIVGELPGVHGREVDADAVEEFVVQIAGIEKDEATAEKAAKRLADGAS